MKQKRIIASFLLLIIILPIFSGCYNYKDINKVTFATTTIFDEDEMGNVLIYLECVKPYRSANESSDKGKRLVYKGKGKSVLEAIRNINMASSYKINFTQCKAYIFTEKVAKNGVLKYLDILSRGQEFMVRPYLFVLQDDVESLLEIVEGDEEYLGLFINDLAIKMGTNPKTVTTNLNEYLNNRSKGYNVNILGTLSLKEDVGKKKIELKGGTIFRDDIMVSKITEGDGISYNFINNNVESGTLQVANPSNENTFITLEILNSKTKTNTKFEGERFKVYKTINIECALAEVQDNIVLTNKSIGYISMAEAETIKQHVVAIFQQYQKKDIDIFNVNRLFEMRYPEERDNENIFSSTDLVVDVNVNIIGSNNSKNTY